MSSQIGDKAIIEEGNDANPEGIILAPEGHTYEELCEQRKNDPVGFALVYQQQAVASGRFITRIAMEKCRRPELKFYTNSLPPEVRSETGVVPADNLATMPYREVVSITRDRVSRDYLVALMRKLGGNVTRAAEQAGMERESLHRLLKRYGVRSEDFK